MNGSCVRRAMLRIRKPWSRLGELAIEQEEWPASAVLRKVAWSREIPANNDDAQKGLPIGPVRWSHLYCQVILNVRGSTRLGLGIQDDQHGATSIAPRRVLSCL